MLIIVVLARVKLGMKNIVEEGGYDWCLGMVYEVFA